MRTRWKILIILLVVGVLSAGLSLLTLHVGPVNSLDAYKNSLRAQGEKLEIAEVSPTPPSSRTKRSRCCRGRLQFTRLGEY